MAVVIGLLAVPALAFPAGTATRLTLSVDAKRIYYGSSTGIRGRLLVKGSPRVGARVRVETASYPRKTPFVRSAADRTDMEGRYSFAAAPKTSIRLRAVSEDPKARTPISRLYVVPRSEVRGRMVSKNTLAETVRFRAPRGVRLTGPVFLYLSRYRAKSVPFVRFGRLRPVAAGVSGLVARFRLPKSWSGGYTFELCYDAPLATGLDDPRDRCTRAPRRP